MINRTMTAFLVASLLSLPVSSPVWAENQMGYQLLSVEQAWQLPRSGGALGMDVGPAQVISDQGLSFELLKVNAVRSGSPGDQAGFHAGDQIIAIDGHVFPSVAAFAAYIGSIQPGRQISVDYMPSGGGPQQAQRLSVTVGGRGQTIPVPQTGQSQSAGLSTGTKVAIGLGAAALFGCYKVGCLSRLKNKLHSVVPANQAQQPVTQ